MPRTVSKEVTPRPVSDNVDKKKKPVVTLKPKIEVQEPVATTKEFSETKQGKGAGHVFYSLYSRSRGWITESLDQDKTCQALDDYHREWVYREKNNDSNKKTQFDLFILKRDTSINFCHSELYRYFPGSFSERRREEHLRAKYGERYRENNEEDDYDYAKYADGFKSVKDKAP